MEQLNLSLADSWNNLHLTLAISWKNLHLSLANSWNNLRPYIQHTIKEKLKGVIRLKFKDLDVNARNFCKHPFTVT